MPEAARAQAHDRATTLAFARFARERFGLAQPGRNLAALGRRLEEAMAAARWDGSAGGFVRELERAPEDSALVGTAIEALTNRETRFFRDPEHLRALAGEVVPKLAAALPPGEPLRILSAGCSSGEETYSLAMLLLDELHLLWGHELVVCGADLSQHAVARARSGSYPSSALARAGEGPAQWPGRFFRRDGERLVARELLRERTSFVRANLLSPLALLPLAPFDLVLCRNVFIYFDAETIAAALRALAGLLRPGGAIVLGCAETGVVGAPEGWISSTGSLCWLSRPEAA